MSVDILLETRNIGCSFSGFKAVDGVSLQVEQGSIHAVIGPNGAGKTTFFNLLTGFVRPTQGQILFDGQDITGRPPEEIANLGIIRSFQISSVFPALSVLQNVRIALQKKYEHRPLNFWSSGKRLNRYNDEALAILETVRLQDKADTLVASMPYGLKRALELATTIALDPTLILLDEPTQGMGHEDVGHVMELVRTIAANRTIVMVEHNMKVVASISDRITVLARGKELITGDYDDVSRDERVIEAYMGRKKGQSLLA